MGLTVVVRNSGRPGAMGPTVVECISRRSVELPDARGQIRNNNKVHKKAVRFRFIQFINYRKAYSLICMMMYGRRFHSAGSIRDTTPLDPPYFYPPPGENLYCYYISPSRIPPC